MKKVIQLNKFTSKNRGAISKFGQELISNLGDTIFEIQDKQELLFRILSQISPINKSLKKDNTSIEKACEKVIRHFGLTKKVKLVSLNQSVTINEEKEDSFTERFSKWIIELDKVPMHEYKTLLQSVNSDLYELSELIEWYEKHPTILRYLKDGEQPKLHEERLVFDFYKRCISERIIILNHQLYGVKKRALLKSRYVYGWMASILAFSEKYDDKPYHFGKVFSLPYFDCRRIDLSGHRVSEFEIDKSVEMQLMYDENKVKFYRLYFKRFPVKKHFEEFHFYLANLPIKQKRDSIFNELIWLFRSRRWISFYALALPQVEGLFSEMCHTIDPDHSLGRKSLTQKVDRIRPHYYLSKHYFDYYQYYIPVQRNRFAHSGYEDDLKLKCFDLLVDLTHLLKVFYELKNPLVEISKLHNQKKATDFTTIKDFVNYFNLVDTLLPKQRTDIQDSIVNFEKEFLSKDCGIELICYNFLQDAPKKLQAVIDIIDTNFKYSHEPIDFATLKRPNIDSMLNDTKQFKILEDSFLYHQDEFEKIETYTVFLNRSLKHIPSLGNDLKKLLSISKTEYGVVLNNILHVMKKVREKSKIQE